MLAVGDPVPAFELEASTGERIAAVGLVGHRWVVYFYPKDNTPGCTTETLEFGSALAEFERLGVRVFGCSIGDVAAKRGFAAACGADRLPLLADPDHTVAEAFGAWGERQFAGHRYLGVARMTVAVGADGRVEQVWTNVKPAGHASAVLGWLRASGGAAG